MGKLGDEGEEYLYALIHRTDRQYFAETTGGAGFRFDAIKHMDRRFLLAFVRK